MRAKATYGSYKNKIIVLLGHIPSPTVAKIVHLGKLAQTLCSIYFYLIDLIVHFFPGFLLSLLEPT